MLCAVHPRALQVVVWRQGASVQRQHWQGSQSAPLLLLLLLLLQESGTQDNAPEVETPSMLQAFVQPYEDLRYITTYVNSGGLPQRRLLRHSCQLSCRRTAAGANPCI